jgi:hypothetical protein
MERSYKKLCLNIIKCDCTCFRMNELLKLVSSDFCTEVKYRGADKPLARPTSRCILFDGEKISFGASLVIYIYINSTNIPLIMIITRIYENQNLLSL